MKSKSVHCHWSTRKRSVLPPCFRDFFPAQRWVNNPKFILNLTSWPTFKNLTNFLDYFVRKHREIIGKAVGFRGNAFLCYRHHFVIDVRIGGNCVWGRRLQKRKHVGSASGVFLWIFIKVRLNNFLNEGLLEKGNFAFDIFSTAWIFSRLQEERKLVYCATRWRSLESGSAAQLTTGFAPTFRISPTLCLFVSLSWEESTISSTV